MNSLKLIIENAIVHKEMIAPVLSDAMNNRSHYNATNSIYPDTLGRGNYLLDNSNVFFKKILGKMKRSHGIETINPKTYFEIKKGIGNLLLEIGGYEKDSKKELNELAELIIRETYGVPDNINFKFGVEDEDFLNDYGSNVIDEFKDKFESLTFDDTYELGAANEKIDRNRMNYCLICGGANNSMNLYKNHEEELDSIDYRLMGLYDKFNSFNNFNLWVSPDEVLLTEIDNAGGFKIHDNNGVYTIIVNAPHFLSTLYEMSKAILSILFQEKYNNPHVDYENPWNTRVGTMAWEKLNKCASDNKNFPYVVDAMNGLADNDYSYVMKEVLSGTNHSKKMFEELYQTF